MDFYTSLSEFYDLLFPPSREQKEWALDFARTGPVLDAGCGTGELLLHIARKGIPGSGFDADDEMVRKAEEKAAGIEGVVDFRKAGLTEAAELYTPSSFSALLCMGNTIAHVQDPQELNRMISGFASLLTEGGRLAIQLLNYDCILAQRPEELPSLTAETDDLKLSFFRRYRYEREHILFTGTLRAESPRAPAKSLEKSFEALLLPVGRETLTAAFSKAGLKNISVWEDYGSTPASEESAVYLFTGKR
ncbi:class I SAM-dependent methyltransferase [Marispirochaeta aestuarii]|uniref:class I SAM-dependent methyltransferase n=1 Tax=Marispirochaeta aestuarii TaxID=1963862 RepID=UPI0029C62D4A|nr:class I SAM-dependent methyltransferase [Marispirochaeta aestuarii]